MENALQDVVHETLVTLKSPVDGVERKMRINMGRIEFMQKWKHMLDNELNPCEVFKDLSQREVMFLSTGVVM